MELYDKYIEDQPSEKISAALRRTFDIGTAWHEYLESILIAMNFVERANVEKYIIHKISSRWGTAYGSGLGDLVGVQIPGRGEWLVDIKSMNKRSFESPSADLMAKYYAQIRLYGDWFKLDNLMILGVCKDSPHALREWIVPQDPLQLQDIYMRWAFVATCIDEKRHPSEYEIRPN